MLSNNVAVVSTSQLDSDGESECRRTCNEKWKWTT